MLVFVVGGQSLGLDSGMQRPDEAVKPVLQDNFHFTS